MTSTLLTDSRAPASLLIERSLLLAAVPHRVLELLAFLHRCRLQLGPDHLAHRLDPVRDDLPLLAVPLLDGGQAVALVVVAAHPERTQEALHPELVQPLLGEVEILEAPAHFLARQGLVAVLGHG